MSFYITTPIYYVNAQPHLGHAYTTIAADVLARHMRQRGEDVFFLTGTDEHGEPVADAARAQGLEPKELADRNAEQFKALAPQLEASNDFFIRTSDEQHKRKVQEVLQRVHDNGHTYKGIYEGWYCPRCADFKVENEILEGNRCPIHEIVLEREQRGELVLPAVRVPGAARAAVRRAARLRDAAAPLQRGALVHRLGPPGRLAVARPAEVGRAGPVGSRATCSTCGSTRCSTTTRRSSYARPGEDLTDRFWPATYHLIGKDILKFHTVFWPAMLMAADLPVPEHVFVHGFLLGSDGRKMSKSLGNVLDPFEVMDEFGTDALRFYLMRDVPFGGDGAVGMDGGQDPLRDRARQRVRQPRQPHDRDGAALPRRRGPGGGHRPGAAIGVRRARRARSPRCWTGAEPTQALEQIWQRVRRLQPLRRGAGAVAAGPRPRRRRAARPDAGLAGRGRCGRSACCCTRTCPRARCACSTRSGHDDAGYGGAQFAERPAIAAVTALEPLFPKRGVIDSHTHLDFCEPPDAELVAASVGGRGDADGHRRDRPARPAARRSRRPRTSRRCTPRSAATRTRPPDSTTPTSPSSRRSPRTHAAWRSARPASTTTATTRPARIRSARSRPRSSSRATTGKPLVIHTRAADDDTLATLRAHARRGSRVILHCFSMPDRVDECLAHDDWWISFAGNVTYPKAPRPAAGGAQRSRRPAAGRDRRPVPGAAGGPRQAQRAGATWSRRRGRWRWRGAWPTRSSTRRSTRNAAAVFGW